MVVNPAITAVPTSATAIPTVPVIEQEDMPLGSRFNDELYFRVFVDCLLVVDCLLD